MQTMTDSSVKTERAAETVARHIEKLILEAPCAPRIPAGRTRTGHAAERLARCCATR